MIAGLCSRFHQATSTRARKIEPHLYACSERRSWSLQPAAGGVERGAGSRRGTHSEAVGGRGWTLEAKCVSLGGQREPLLRLERPFRCCLRSTASRRMMEVPVHMGSPLPKF
jgi:hypothetical protein